MLARKAGYLGGPADGPAQEQFMHSDLLGARGALLWLVPVMLAAARRAAIASGPGADSDRAFNSGVGYFEATRRLTATPPS